MTKTTKTLLAIVIFAVFLTGAVFLYNSLSERYPAKNPPLIPEQEKLESPAQGNTERPGANPGTTEEARLEAPDFSAIDGEGNEVRLSDFRGTPVVLNFWASWCGPCRSEMPTFNKVSQEYTEDELVFLMVDLVDGQRETVEKGRAYIEENGFTFKVLYDTMQEAAYAYGIRAIPSTLFIDKNGYILAGVEGAIREETLRLGIDLILETD